jgi:hypothetical protein
MSSVSYFLYFDFIMYTAENANSHKQTEAKMDKQWNFLNIRIFCLVTKLQNLPAFFMILKECNSETPLNNCIQN